MNRRNFLKSLAIGIMGLNINTPITPIFKEFVDIGPVGDFEYYIEFQIKMWVMNPRSCGIITNMGE